MAIDDKKVAKRIAFDIDGVLYPWHELIHEYMRYFHNLSQSFDEFWLEASTGVNPDTEIIMMGFAQMLDVYEKRVADRDMIKTLKKLDKTYDIFYITNRPESAKFVTRKWFRDSYLPSQDNLIFVEGSKLQTLKDLEIDIYIEDRSRHIREVVEDGVDIDLYVVEKPWNREVCELDEVTPIYHVTELMYFLGVEDG